MAHLFFTSVCKVRKISLASQLLGSTRGSGGEIPLMICWIKPVDFVKVKNGLPSLENNIYVVYSLLQGFGKTPIYIYIFNYCVILQRKRTCIRWRCNLCVSIRYSSNSDARNIFLPPCTVYLHCLSASNDLIWVDGRAEKSCSKNTNMILIFIWANHPKDPCMGYFPTFTVP